MSNEDSSHKEYFHQAYQTGTDEWSHRTYTQHILSFARSFPHKSMILDLGSGRGEWAFTFADLGHRVVGIDYISSVVLQNNEKVKDRGYEGRLAFMEGDVFSIPLQDQTIDVVTDIETLQHIHPKDWEQYVEEVYRVLKPGGFVFLVQLSRKTQDFFGVDPRKETTGNIERFGLLYHFFDIREMQDMFGKRFSVIKHEALPFPAIQNHHYIFCLLRKN